MKDLERLEKAKELITQRLPIFDDSEYICENLNELRFGLLDEEDVDGVSLTYFLGESECQIIGLWNDFKELYEILTGENPKDSICEE